MTPQKREGIDDAKMHDEDESVKESTESTEKKLTMAELDALERYGKNPQSCRRSARRSNRISTSSMRRLHEIFWKDDSLYEDENNKNDTESDDSGSSSEEDGDSLRPTKKKQKPCNVLNFGKRHSWRKVHDSPHIYIMDDFLLESEIRYCEAKIRKTKTFQKSVVDKFSNETTVDQDQRTSTFLRIAKMEHGMVASMERRAADLLGITVDQLEPLQLVRYQEGQFFGIHHDMGVLYEDGSVELPPKQPWAKRRLVTIFCYLNDVGEGGCTHFPVLDLRVKPKRGRAVLFCNIDKHGNPDPRTVHAGEPVLKSKESDSDETCNKKDVGEPSILSNPNVKYGINIWACEE